MTTRGNAESVVDWAEPPVPPPPRGGLYLADDLWLIAHDRPSHKSWLSERGLSVGLAGAVLAELVLAERLTVDAGRLHVLSRDPAPDSLMHDVMAAVLSQPDGQDVRTWLEYLAGRGSDEIPLRTAVAARLMRAGVLQREDRRGLLRTSVLYVPVDGRAGWPAVRLRSQARESNPIPIQDFTLVGLVAATELNRRVFEGHLQKVDAYLWWCTRQLTAPLQTLVDEVRAAIARAVATPM